jgi:hypothetical protein
MKTLKIFLPAMAILALLVTTGCSKSNTSNNNPPPNNPPPNNHDSTKDPFTKIEYTGSTIFSEARNSLSAAGAGNKIVFAGYNHGNYSLILFNLLTNEELSVVNKLKEYNVDQLRLVYELCLRLLSGQVIPSNRCDEVKKTFETLPTDMKELLYKLKLFNKESVSSQGWFSGCALF